MTIFEQYDISPSMGFLPEIAPLTKLPEYYQPWDRLGNALPDLLLAGVLRNKVDELPILDDQFLNGKGEMERAMLMLSFLAHAYLREPELKNLPASIAVPWCSIAKKMGRLPVLSHASAVLHNWRKLDEEKPMGLDNLALIQSFEGGKDEAWFFLVTAMIELHGASVVKGIIEVMEDESPHEISLKHILEGLKAMTATLQRMPEHCEPSLFYNRLRPYLASLVEVRYDGVSDVPMSYAGGSAAQSSIVQSLDAALGIAHREVTSASFLLEMRKYMPPAHAKFIEMLENTQPLAKLGEKHHGMLEMIKSELHRFRTEHLKIYHRYVAAQMKKTSLGDTGTGGTDAALFLKQLKDDTKGR